jgi:PAS domain S-box-containing protein
VNTVSTDKPLTQRSSIFLSGGGEMSRRMLEHDWSTSPLGAPDTWPQSLRTAVSLMITSRHPMFIAWGPDLAFLYNDGYIPIFGTKHPGTLGRPFKQVWSEIWDDIWPLVERALAGEPTWSDDLHLVMERNGYPEDTWYSFSYSPIRDETGGVAGMFCACQETTARVLAARQQVAETQRQRRMFEQAPGFIAMLSGPDHVFELTNKAYQQLIGHRDVIGKPAREGLPEVASQGFVNLLDEVYASGKPFVGTAVKVSLQSDPGGQNEDRFLDFVYQPVTDGAGNISGIFVEGSDVTERVRGEEALLEAQRRLDAVLNNASVAIFLMDEHQQCSYMNAAAETLTGYTFAETQGRTLHDVVHHTYPDGRHFPIEECAIDRAFPTNANVQGEEVFVHKDGSFYPVAYTASPINDDQSRTIGTIIEVRDIRAEKAVEAALREESRTLETLNRIGATVAGELDLDRAVQMVTDAGVELTGAEFGAFFYNVTNDAGESFLLYTLSGADRSAFERFGNPRATAVFAPTFAGEGIMRSHDILADPRYGKNEPHFGMPKGHLPVRSYLAVPVSSRSGEVIGGLFFGHPEPGRFSERHERLMTGIASHAAIALDNAQLYRALQRANQTLEARVEERTADRDRMWRLSTDLMLVARFDGTIVAVNPAWAGLLGWEQADLVETSFLDLIHPDDLEATRAEAGKLEQGMTTLRFMNRYRARDGHYVWLSWTAVPDEHFIHAVARDVTAEKEAAAELEQAQEALRQAQKMEAVGQLTGGLAHDFNNLLAGISGSLEFMGDRIAQGRMADVERYLVAAQGAAKRAAALTHRLLAFSRRQTLDPKPTNVATLINGMEDLIRRTVGPSISLESVAGGGVWSVLVDPNQLENALLNLSINARDAMPDGGKITIETANRWLDERAAKMHDLASGQYVSLCVSDNGTGMSPEVVEKAFDPFFTTKPIGMGTGLGLSMIYGFARQSGGQVRIYSELGQGTMICIYLPRYHGEAGPVEDLSHTPSPRKAGAGETVLVIDDEPLVRMLVVDALEELGYASIEAGDGPSGMKILESDARIDLLITDVGLPNGMNGRQVADAARQLRDGLKVLFVTGYAENAVLNHGHLEHGMQVITKPFDMAELTRRIQSIISEA